MQKGGFSKIIQRKLKSYFPILPESITESQKLLLYKYMVALVKYYKGKTQVVHYFDDFKSDNQIDLYSWMKLHSKPADCENASSKNSNDSPKSWDDSENSSQKTVIENKNFKPKDTYPLNPQLFQRESGIPGQSLLSRQPPHQQTDTPSHNQSQPPTTDLFIALRQKYNSLPDNLKLKHPMIYPELYQWDDQNNYFGTRTAKDIILDGSNVAFGHGQFEPNGKYIKKDNYNFQNKTCRFS